MSEPQAYFNGQFIPAAQALLSVSDSGLVLGASVTEQLRTFNGQLFRLDEHLGRLERSLEIVGVDPGEKLDDFARIARQLVENNLALLAEGDDLGLAIFVTPGPYPTLAEGRGGGPTVCLHTYPLPFGLWANKYSGGESLVISKVRQIPPESWPPELKCRSRMHYYLAQREAEAIDPGARALLLDQQGFVTETVSANVVIYVASEGLVIPPRKKVLPGISLAVLIELARGLSIPVIERDLKPQEVAAADEVMLTSTTVCMLPVVRLNRTDVGSGKPGPIYSQLLEAWCALVGLDIASQAARFARR